MKRDRAVSGYKIKARLMDGDMIARATRRFCPKKHFTSHSEAVSVKFDEYDGENAVDILESEG